MNIWQDTAKTKAGLFFLLLLLSVFSTAAFCAPVIISGGGGSTTTINVAENNTFVINVQATDADQTATLTYSVVGGTDQSLFTIGSTTGTLAFKTAPDFENPSDVDGDDNYQVIVQASDGTDTASQAITVTVIDVNDNAPVIISDGGGSTATINVAENTTAVATVEATDADAGTALIYSIAGGIDQGLFSIDGATGLLAFKAAPDFENPSDADGDGNYEVTVQASDGLHSADQAITVTVTDVNDNAPVIISGGGGSTATINVAENNTFVINIQATDADAGTTLMYSIVGGIDQDLFSIDGATGLLAFKAAPDFENPSDANGDGNYEVTVQASDGPHTASQAITVKVTDAVEQYRLDITVTGHGQVDASASPTPLDGNIVACTASSGSCQADYAPDAAVSLTATPATGWHFDQWGDDCGGAIAGTNISMDAAKSCAATFAIDQYTLSYSAGAHGSINGAASQIVDYGADGNAVTAVPDANYRFVQWSDGSTDNPRTDTNVTSDLSISASFASTIVTAAPVPMLDWRALLILAALLGLVAQRHMRRT